jgi:L-cysteine S-thiosulfotransferase
VGRCCSPYGLSRPLPTRRPPPDGRRSGFEFMGAGTQAMQRDDTLNPAMLWVQEGEQLRSRPVGAAGRSCTSCHGDARVSMRAVVARHPAVDSALQRPVDLRQRIAACRRRQQPGLPQPGEEQAQLSLEAYVGLQSRGLALAPPQDARLEPYRERGRTLFEQRVGQLDLSCADCHDKQAGRHLGGRPIPQGHATGNPIYRLQWQGLGSLQRRLRSCISGVRAEPFAWGAPELVELELYLAWRARGMPLKTPAVRP